MMRKYLISQTAQRVAHFLAQVLEETGLLRLMKEGGGETRYYAPYYGRGIIQLTFAANYRIYGNYRGFPRTNPSTDAKYREIGWDPDVLMVLDDAHFNRENAADAGGFYWASPAAANGNERADGGVALANMVSVSRLINGNVAFHKLNGLDMRIGLFIYLKYQLLDEIRTASTESLTFAWRRNSAPEPVLAADGTPVLDSHGIPVKLFFPGNHTVAFPLDPQRP
jgi:predicted chitinase